MVHEQPKEMFKLLTRWSDNLFEKLVGEKDQCFLELEGHYQKMDLYDFEWMICIPLSSQKVVIYVFITCCVFKAKRQKAQQIKRSYMSFLCHFFC